jgi:hypothetical protein
MALFPISKRESPCPGDVSEELKNTSEQSWCDCLACNTAVKSPSEGDRSKGTASSVSGEVPESMFRLSWLVHRAGGSCFFMILQPTEWCFKRTHYLQSSFRLSMCPDRWTSNIIYYLRPYFFSSLLLKSFCFFVLFKISSFVDSSNFISEAYFIN